MANRDTEAFLRALARASEDELRPSEWDTARLEAYREGRLSVEEAATVERDLASSASARRALAQAGGVSTDPPHAVREMVLEAYAERAPSRWLGWRLMVAAVFVAALFGAQLLLRPDRALPPFEVGVYNTSEVRTGGPSRSLSEAFVGFAGDPIGFEIRPTWDAVAAGEPGLFRRRGGVVERVDQEAWVERPDSFDAAGTLLVRSAGDLVGERPGTRTVWVVLAWRGDLPGRLEVSEAADEAAITARLASDGARHVHPVSVTIRPPLP